MNESRFLSNKKLIIRQIIVSWAVFTLSVLLYVILALLLFNFIKNQEIVVIVAFLLIVPVIVYTHIILNRNGYSFPFISFNWRKSDRNEDMVALPFRQNSLFSWTVVGGIGILKITSKDEPVQTFPHVLRSILRSLLNYLVSFIGIGAVIALVIFLISSFITGDNAKFSILAASLFVISFLSFVIIIAALGNSHVLRLLLRLTFTHFLNLIDDFVTRRK